MINESFDDDIPDETEDQVVAAFEAGEKGVTAQPGDFSRILAGRTVWFTAPVPGQFHAWKRYRESLQRRWAKVADKARKEPSLEILAELAELSEKFDTATLELVESLMKNPDDVDFVAEQMIGGKVTIIDIHQVLFGDPGTEDDVPEVAKPRKAAKKSATPRKKTANATRVRK